MNFTCAQYIAMLADAQTALHKLMIGSKVETLRDGEMQLSYTKANLDALRTYIDMLQRHVDCCNGVRPNSRRVMHVLPLG